MVASIVLEAQESELCAGSSRYMAADINPVGGRDVHA